MSQQELHSERKTPPNVSFGFILVAIGATLFSSKSILVKLAYQYEVSPIELITLRMLFAIPFYIGMGILLHQKGLTRLNHPATKSFIYATLLGITGYYGASFFDFWGLTYINANLERMILYIYPTLVVILSAILFRTTIKPSLVFCIGITYIGLFIIFNENIEPSNTSFNLSSNSEVDNLNIIKGSGLVMLSALLFAIYCIGGEQVMRSMSSQLFTVYAMLGASFMTILHYIVIQPVHLLMQFNMPIYLLAFSLAIFCTVIPSFLVSAGIQRIGASKASIVGSMGPVVTLLLAAAILSEPITILQLLGFGTVIFGVLTLASIKEKAPSTLK